MAEHTMNGLMSAGINGIQETGRLVSTPTGVGGSQHARKRGGVAPEKRDTPAA